MAESVYEIFKDKASLARDAADRRSAEVWSKDKRIAEIDRELSETGMKIFAAALSGEENRDAAYKALELRLISLKAEKKDRLTALGLPEDYTDVKYECEKCSDTGYVGIKMCDCLRRAITQQNFKNSGLGKYLENQTFESFDLSYYAFGEIREKMSGILEYTKSYAKNFSPADSESLLLVGATGLGKTHLSSAIAKCVIEKGYTVAYDSAQNIISAFERDRFAKDGERRDSEKYLNSDLLIIDDLGAEVQSKAATAYFYTIINTRILASKPTIVSTNLTPTQLNTQYERRIVSRLFGEYRVYEFAGDDIRGIKKLRS